MKQGRHCLRALPARLHCCAVVASASRGFRSLDKVGGFTGHAMQGHGQVAMQGHGQVACTSRGFRGQGGSKRQESDSTRMLGAVMFLSAAVGTAMLGKWQLDRKAWKEALIAERQTEIVDRPYTPLADLLSKLESGEITEKGMEYTKVTVRGVYDHQHQMLYGPRSISQDEAPKAGVNHCYYVVTPFRTEEGPILLVNRGWVPKRGEHVTMSYNDPQKESRGKTVTISGVLRPGENKPPFLPQTATGNRSEPWMYLDLPGMLRFYGQSGLKEEEREWLMPLVLEVTENEDAQAAIADLPFPGQLDQYITYQTMPLTHLIYATTWFSLSAALIVLTFIRFRRVRAGPTNSQHISKSAVPRRTVA